MELTAIRKEKVKSLLDEFIEDFPDIPLYLRGDSGFASPNLYEVLEDKNGFDFAAVSSSTKLVNANRLLVHALFWGYLLERSVIRSGLNGSYDRFYAHLYCRE